jgi:cAMP phosphodiesterase
MRIELVPSTVGEQAAKQFCIAALVNDSLAIDAGTIGMLWPFERQLQIQHVFLTHSHVDHIASLPLFLDSIYQPGPTCPAVYACPATVKCLREDVFNDRLWPDFIRLSAEESPFLKLQTLTSETTVHLPNMTVTPVALNHVVPTMGFVVQEENCAVGFVSDTNRTDRIWEVLAQVNNLKAVFLECSFPDSHRWLADKSGHLCPELFAEYVRQLPASVKVITTHLKPCFFNQITDDLNRLQLPNVEIGVPGQCYEF